MQLHNLGKTNTARQAKRIGRGGKRGSYSGRGIKGQKARAGHRIRPQVRDELKKLHKKRGFGIHRADSVRAERKVYSVVSLSALEHLGEVRAITPEVLVKTGILTRKQERRAPVKILGSGTLTKKISVTGCAVSASARKAIEAAGGTVK